MTAANSLDKRHEIVPSGKYKGWTVSQVPSAYWDWLTSYGQTSSLFNWYTGTNKKTKSKKSKSRHKQVSGINPLVQGAKTGPVHSSKIYRVITKEDGTTTRTEYPRHGSHT
jgi:hypothetical protein